MALFISKCGVESLAAGVCLFGRVQTERDIFAARIREDGCFMRQGSFAFAGNVMRDGEQDSFAKLPQPTVGIDARRKRHDGNFRMQAFAERTFDEADHLLAFRNGK